MPKYGTPFVRQIRHITTANIPKGFGRSARNRSYLPFLLDGDWITHFDVVKQGQPIPRRSREVFRVLGPHDYDGSRMEQNCFHRSWKITPSLLERLQANDTQIAHLLFDLLIDRVGVIDLLGE